MAMLDRIKRKQLDGFKEFVQNMETTGLQGRTQIFTAGVLEDPLYMSWVMKNLRTFDDFLKLESDDIDSVIASQEQMIGIFAKAMHGLPEAELMALERVIPRSMSRFKDELSYLSSVSTQERDSARLCLLKTARKLQIEEKIIGFSWKLPPMDVFYPKTYKDGVGVILFESGETAAKGEFSKGKRTAYWTHYYETGKVLAEGEYHDGMKTDFWIFFYGNGNMKAKGRYKQDVKCGIWQEWDRSGVLTEVEYVDGIKKSA